MKKEKRTSEEMKMRKNKGFEDRYSKGIHFDIRSKGSCYITMQTNVGEMTVYIDSMDGLDDAPYINAWIPYRREKLMIMGKRKYKLKSDQGIYLK